MRSAFSLVVSLPLMASSAFGWGCEGHQTIALIARAHLTPAASAAVDRLLRENPIDPDLKRYCMDRPADPMADVATWADDTRNVEKTAEWHYINIPLAVETGSVPEKDALKWCAPLADGKPGCIVTAIETEWAILRDPAQAPAARAKALRYVIHFVGDIAQPLHDVENRDQGANCTSVQYFTEEKPRNLHSIWDTQLIRRELTDTKSDQAAYAAKLDRDFTGHWSDWGESRPDALAWAWQGHTLAETVAYGDLKPSIPVEPPSASATDDDACKAERAKVAELHIAVDDVYAAKAMPVIREQLARAGYRLAGLLNQTLR